MKRSFIASLVAGFAVAQSDTWWGLRPNQASASAVDVITLSDKGAVDSVVGTIKLGNGEVTWPDGFRCVRGFCLFSTTQFVSGVAVGSFVYNISNTDASVTSKIACPGLCADVHVDYSSGQVYTLSRAIGKAVLSEVTPAGVVSILDVTNAVGSGTVQPGQTTHCSEQGPSGHFFVGVNNGGKSDVVLSIDLASRQIDLTYKLAQPLFAALWAKCAGDGVIGGLSATPSGGLAFGSVDTTGTYTPGDSVSLPGGYTPTGLLTAMPSAGMFLGACEAGGHAVPRRAACLLGLQPLPLAAPRRPSLAIATHPPRPRSPPHSAVHPLQAPPLRRARPPTPPQPWVTRGSFPPTEAPRTRSANCLTT